MISRQQLTRLINEENLDALNNIYWELPSEYQRIVDKTTSRKWTKPVGELSVL